MTETISIKIPRGLLAKLDGATDDRSDFVREALQEKLNRNRPKGKSAWEALEGVAGLDVTFEPVRDQVKLIPL